MPRNLTKLDCRLRTPLGRLYFGDVFSILQNSNFQRNKGKFDLILTSPPFPLNRKKRYGNLTGDNYLKWIGEFGSIISEYLSPQGSLIIEIGNAWNKGSPTFSTLPYESLLAIKENGKLHLCQEFIYYNPAKLPTPTEWVNKKRIRVKDSFTKIWWLSKSPNPKANNRNVLVKYSKKMEELLDSGKYNSGKRPSEHKLGTESFLKDNGGAIPSNVIIASNTTSSDQYLNFCRKNKLQPHPARMPAQIVEFFLSFLTNEGDLVFDPFAGSNTTGYIANVMNRRWLATESNESYIETAHGRFQ